MSQATREAGRAARLVGFALQPKVAQGADPDYAELCSEYRTTESFREMVESVADGLGLVVLDYTEQGLVVAPSEGSPFAFRLTDYQRGLDPRKRTLIGLAHLGIAAVCYPREADLDGDIVVRRTVVDVETLLRQACEDLAGDADDDAVADDDELTEAWRVFAATPASRVGRHGGYLSDCTLGIITNAFEWLTTQGMARATNTPGTYQVLDRYRVQIRELAGHATFEHLRSLAAAEDSPAADDPLDPGEDTDEEAAPC